MTPDLDYIIVSRWDAQEFVRLKDAFGSKLPNDLPSLVQKDVEARLGNVFVARRLNLSAPGTSALAFFSDIEAAPTKLLWSIKLPEWKGKLLALYLNSSFNLLQTLLNRTETEGAFIEVSEYVLSKFLTPNLEDLSSEQRSYLLSVYEQVKDTNLPSLMEQLQLKNNARRRIDKAWLKILGYKGDKEELLTRLYLSLAKEITVLMGLMGSGAHPKEQVDAS